MAKERPPRKDPAELVRRFWSLKGKMRALFVEMDEITDELIRRGCVGERFDVDGATIALVDNFVAKNKVYRPHGISRYEIAEVKGGT